MSRSGRTPPAPKFRVELNWKLALFALLLLPLLVSLGLWQLQRAEEKRTIQESWQKQQALPPVPFSAVKEAPGENFRRVATQGVFDAEHYWLLENQIVDGRLGYAVLMPFVVEGAMGQAAEVVVVNRGWVPAAAYRAQLPEFDTPSGPVWISGRLVKPSSNRLISETGEPPVQWPATLLEVDLTAIERQLYAAGYSHKPYERVLRLDAESPGALHVNWQPINMSPATHRGYAVQWFALAFALIILSIFANSNLGEILFRRGK